MTHVLCDACTTPPLSSCKPWESGCAVPNHSYNIANVELPLNKGVCKDSKTAPSVAVWSQSNMAQVYTSGSVDLIPPYIV